MQKKIIFPLTLVLSLLLIGFIFLPNKSPINSQAEKAAAEKSFIPQKASNVKITPAAQISKAEAIDSPNNPETSLSSLAEARQQVNHWLKTRGYEIEDQLLELTEQDRSMHPYADYNKETLSALANNDDAVAQMALGIKFLKTEGEEARKWLRLATINGGYSNTMLLIADSYFAEYQSNLMNANRMQPPIDPKSEKRAATETLKHQALVWALAADLRQDFVAQDTLEKLEYVQLTPIEQDEFRLQASQLLKELNQQRASRGLEPFLDFPLSKASVEMYLAHDEDVVAIAE